MSTLPGKDSNKLTGYFLLALFSMISTNQVWSYMTSTLLPRNMSNVSGVWMFQHCLSQLVGWLKLVLKAVFYFSLSHSCIWLQHDNYLQHLTSGVNKWLERSKSKVTLRWSPRWTLGDVKGQSFSIPPTI